MLLLSSSAAFAAGCGQSVPPSSMASLPAARAGRTAMAAKQAPLVYAVNEFGFSVTAYPQSANGNVTPVVDLAGSNTKIYEPTGLAVSSNGTVAVTEASNTVTFYAPGANGNVVPTATLGCPSGGVPGQLAFDKAGNLYVQYFLGHLAASGEIAIYEPSQQNGCVPGARVLYGSKTKIPMLAGIAVGGQLVYAAYGTGVVGFKTGQQGNVRPRVNIEGPKTGLNDASAIAVDMRGTLYVANGKNVVIFAPHANHNAKPAAVIGGGRTLIPANGAGTQSVAIGKNGNLFVGIQNGSVFSILVFAAGATGNVAPIQVITGSSTGLDTIAQLAVLD